MAKLILNIGQNNNRFSAPSEHGNLIVTNAMSFWGDNFLHGEVNAQGTWEGGSEPTTILVVEWEYSREEAEKFVKELCEQFTQQAIGYTLDGKGGLAWRKGETEEYGFNEQYFLQPSPRVDTRTWEGMYDGFVWGDGIHYDKDETQFNVSLAEDKGSIQEQFAKISHEDIDEESELDEEEFQDLKDIALGDTEPTLDNLKDMAFALGLYYYTEWEMEDTQY